MTQKMPTRSSTPIRKRDWGTTPVLFSLKNVQPMLVAGPARPEGNVAAPSSFADIDPAVVATGAAAFGTEGTETRIKPQAALLKNFSYQNWIASALVVLLILFVIRISVSTESKTPGVAKDKSTQGSPAALVAAETSVSPQTAPSGEQKSAAATSPASVPMLTLDAPAPPVSGANPSPLLIPSALPTATPETSGMGLANSSMASPAMPALAIPSTISPEPTSASPFASNTEPGQSSGATLFAAAPANNAPANGMTSTPPDSTSAIPASPFPSNSPAQGMNFEVGKPELQLGPAEPANSMTGNFNAGQSNAFNAANVPSNNEVAVNIQQTLTPDQPLAAFKELYNEAKRFDGQSYGNASYGNVPATPVSTGGTANGYQPMLGSDPNAAASMNAQPNGYQPMGVQQTGTQLSGQAYPPVQQEYKPISFQDPNGTTNRYQPIRQPAGQVAPANGTGNAYPQSSGTTASPTQTQAPYVPVGTTTYPPFN